MHATRSFRKREDCDFHKSAFSALGNNLDVSDMLHAAAVWEKDKKGNIF